MALCQRAAAPVDHCGQGASGAELGPALVEHTAMTEDDAEIRTQEEVREDAETEGSDPVTSREGVEQELMAQGESEIGEDLGDEMP